MKSRLIYFSIIITLLFINATSYSAYFHDDNEFSDILINNKLSSEWVAVPESQIPSELKPLSITKGNINEKQICLVPFKVLSFNKNGTFVYLWKQSSSKTGEIRGNWKVENSTLILTLAKDYAPSYKRDSELRYKIIKILHADTTLKYSGTHYPGIPETIKTTDDPLKDFSNIVIAIEKENTKNL